MRISISYRQVNANFNAQFAKDFHLGKESDGNRKYLWEEQVKVKANVRETNVIESGDYILRQLTPEGRERTFRIPNMYILQCFIDSGDIMEYAVSAELLDLSLPATRTTNGKTFFNFHLKDNTDYINAGNGIIIATTDYPVELLVKAVRA